ncbi:MAG: hypothetical protein KC609_09250 [Myxococcales bacterium]|nr:hypothetical protein [Myxococcales bacterium]
MNRSRQVIRFWIALSFAFTLSAKAVAAPPAPRDQVRRYNGSYWSVGLLAGLSLLENRAYSHRAGYLVGVEGRLVTVMHLFGVGLTYSHAGYNLGLDGVRIRSFRHTVAADVYVHPLFFVMLSNSWFYYALSTFHISLGTGLEITQWRPTGAPARTEADASFRLGCGMEMPLDNPHDGGAFWLGWAYQFSYMRVDTRTRASRTMSEHGFFLTLSYRTNGW